MIFDVLKKIYSDFYYQKLDDKLKTNLSLNKWINHLLKKFFKYPNIGFFYACKI